MDGKSVWVRNDNKYRSSEKTIELDEVEKDSIDDMTKKDAKVTARLDGDTKPCSSIRIVQVKVDDGFATTLHRYMNGKKQMCYHMVGKNTAGEECTALQVFDRATPPDPNKKDGCKSQ